VYICWNKCKRRKCDHQTMSLQKVKSNANLILFYSLEQLISKFVNWKSLPFILIQKSSIVEIANDNKHLSRQLCTCPILLQRKKKKGRLCISYFIKSDQWPHAPGAPFSKYLLHQCLLDLNRLQARMGNFSKKTIPQRPNVKQGNKQHLTDYLGSFYDRWFNKINAIFEYIPKK